MIRQSPVGLLVALVVVLLVLSAFFSATETALMSLNRYRLRHQARSGHRAARVAEWLLQRPDRLIGLILLGNTGANIAAAALVTVRRAAHRRRRRDLREHACALRSSC